jgi:integrase
VEAIDTALVMKALEPIWTEKPETASRVRGRIERVLDWAKVQKLRSGENPARWRGHLDHLLPGHGKVKKVKHHSALPYVQLGDFMEALRAEGGIAAKALVFLILAAGRTGEVIGARWGEFDLGKRIWTIPGERMRRASLTACRYRKRPWRCLKKWRP